MAERRSLAFNEIDEVMPEVDRLVTGHETVGRWTLGQILHHLAVAVRLSTDGKPDAESIEGRDRRRVYRRLFFRAGRFPEKADPPLEILIPPDDCDLVQETEALRDALDRFKAHDGPFSSHPVLGALDGAEWSRFHLMHCAHHLGFATPQPGVSPGENDPGSGSS